MPTYEYKCQKCNKNFEVFQNLKEKPLNVCTECSGKLVKVFHPVGIIYKTSGFYTTDYKKEKAKPVKPKTAQEKETAKKAPAKPAASTSTAS